MLALSITVPLVGYSTPDVDRYIADARSQAGVIGDDIGRLDTRLAALPPTLRAEVRSAVESAKAATDQATAALDAAASNTPERASATLADAQVALDAAVAQVRFVTDLAANADSEITGFLRGLQDHLNDMRGETLNVVG